MDTKKLRQKILDLAIRGKLVPQDPNDEPASVLLERIRAEKERLVKEGKIKKSKAAKTSDTPHYENVPFEIPSSWVWTTLGELCSIKGGKRIPKGKTFSKEKTEHIYLRVTDMKDNSIIMSDLKYIDDDVYNEIKNYIINSSDLYLTIAGTIGSVGTVPDLLDGMNLTENAAKLTNILCDKMYLMYSLLSTIAQEHFSSRFHQVAQPKLSIETASKTLLPIPPIEEQQRIVAEIKKWFTQIDQIEQGKADIQTAIKQTKSKILDLAIHGKLVPQDPNDESASELLKRINPAAEITCDNGQYEKVPFEVPSSWVWTTLGSISNYGENKNVQVENIGAEEWILELEDIEKDSAKIIQHFSKKERRINGTRHKFSTGEILYSRLRTYLNKVLIAPSDGYCTTEIMPFGTFGILSNDYVCHVLRSPYFLDYTIQCGYGVKMPRLSTADACNGMIPLPPLAEQKRIIDAIHAAFAKLDAIMESL